MQTVRPGKCKYFRSATVLVLLPIAAAGAVPAAACTSILVTRAASADGSVMVTYSCEDPGAMGGLGIEPAADHKPGEVIRVPPRIIDDEVGPGGRIPQVPHTYRVLCGSMNEYQVLDVRDDFYRQTGGQKSPRAARLRSDDETWPGARSDGPRGDRGDDRAGRALRLWRHGGVDFGGRSARGMDFRDRRERAGRQGRHLGGGAHSGRRDFLPYELVADRRGSPARSGQFPVLQECRRARRQPRLVRSEVGPAVSFLRRLLYSDASHAAGMRDADVECLSEGAPSKHFSPDYARSKPGSQPYPFSVKPDHKLSVADVFALMRDHFEGTDFDMTKGLDAGPFGSPGAGGRFSGSSTG